MIWYLIICGLNSHKSDCTFSPPLTSKAQCEFVQRQVNAMNPFRATRCIGVQKP